MNEWRKTLAGKAAELELIASWASITNLGRVRDFARQAKYEITQEIARLDEIEAMTAKAMS